MIDLVDRSLAIPVCFQTSIDVLDVFPHAPLQDMLTEESQARSLSPQIFSHDHDHGEPQMGRSLCTRGRKI